jgi:hypothetical protein
MQRGAEHPEKEGMALRAWSEAPQHCQTCCCSRRSYSILSARSADLCGLCVEQASRQPHRPRQFRPDSPPPPSRDKVSACWSSSSGNSDRWPLAGRGRESGIMSAAIIPGDEMIDSRGRLHRHGGRKPARGSPSRALGITANKAPAIRAAVPAAGHPRPWRAFRRSGPAAPRRGAGSANPGMAWWVCR